VSKSFKFIIGVIVEIIMFKEIISYNMVHVKPGIKTSTGVIYIRGKCLLIISYKLIRKICKAVICIVDIFVTE